MGAGSLKKKKKQQKKAFEAVFEIVKNRKAIVDKLKVSNKKLREEHKVFIERLKEVI